MSADEVFFWANWVLIGALVIGVLATYAIVVSGNIRDRELKRELAEQRTLTAQAKLETARLETAIQSRHINLAVPTSSLTPFAGTHIRVQAAPDFEPRRLGSGIVGVLKSAGWDVEIVPDLGFERGKPYGMPFDGIEVITKMFRETPNPEQKKIFEAAEVLTKYLREALHPPIDEEYGFSSVHHGPSPIKAWGLRDGEISLAIGLNPGLSVAGMRRDNEEFLRSVEANKSLPK